LARDVRRRGQRSIVMQRRKPLVVADVMDRAHLVGARRVHRKDDVDLVIRGAPDGVASLTSNRIAQRRTSSGCRVMKSRIDL